MTTDKSKQAGEKLPDAGPSREAPTQRVNDYYSAQRGETDQEVHIVAFSIRLTQQHVAPGKALVVHADTILLAENLVNPGKAVILNARVIESDGNVAIDTSGKLAKSANEAGPAKQNGLSDPEIKAHGTHGKKGNDGLPGEPGQDAGNIYLAAEQYRLGGNLSLKADGGRGGRGQDGGAGSAGTAGQTGNDAEKASTWLKRASWVDKQATVGGKGGNGGDGGNAGLSDRGGRGGEILVTAVQPIADDTIVMVSAKGGEGGEAAAPGEGAKGASGGQGGLIGDVMRDSNLGTIFYLTRDRAATGESGKDGTKGAEGCTGARGGDGRLGDAGDGKPTTIAHTHFWGAIRHETIESYGMPTEFINAMKEKNVSLEGTFRVSPRGLPRKRRLTSIPERRATLVDTRTMGSLEQYRLTLHQARLAYLVEDFDTAATLLSWLLKVTPTAKRVEALDATPKDTLSDFEKQLRGNALWNELKAWEARAPGADGMVARHEELDARARVSQQLLGELVAGSPHWLALRATAAALLAQMGNGLDVFGHPLDWVPLMPLKKYQEQAASLIAAATLAENLYKEYADAEGKQETARSVLDRAIDAGTQRSAALHRELNEIAASKVAVRMETDTLLEEIQAKRADLEKNAGDFVAALKNKLAFDSAMNVFDLVVSGVSLCTGVGSVGSALKAGGALSGAIKNFIETGETIVIDKSNKTERQAARDKRDAKSDLDKSIADVKRVLSNGKAVWTAGSNLITLHQQSNAAKSTFGYGAGVLQMTRREFDELLAPVLQKVPEKAKEYRQVFSNFLDVVETYHATREAGDALYLREERIDIEIAGLDEQIKKQGQLANTAFDPGLPEIRTYLLTLYSDAKMALLSFLHEEYQAYRYWSLGSASYADLHDRHVEKNAATGAKTGARTMKGMLGNMKISDAHVSYLANIHAAITYQIGKDINGKLSAEQQLKALAIELTDQTHPEILRVLRESGRVTFSLSADDPTVATAMAGKADVRAKRCVVMLPGLFRDKGKAHITVVHAGRSEIYGKTGETLHFTHHPTRLFVEYTTPVQRPKGDAKRRSMVNAVSGGNLGGGDERIPVSPLSTWTIGVPQKDPRKNTPPMNVNANCAGIERIELYFDGWASAL